MATTLQPIVDLLSTAHFLMLNSEAVEVKCLFGVFSLVLAFSPAFTPHIGPHLGSCNVFSSDAILSSWQTQEETLAFVITQTITTVNSCYPSLLTSWNIVHRPPGHQLPR